ncbi:hypothetical protein J7U46_16870 [Pelomonas sp. V22]|uniref:hypothetical protein n=1 Tax=Pelomonas sp. V22 TaxID=2822139 RepID=UPI0024A8989B|nr:hypothetical protein [Pelomonas sp. V22]MDI4634736.1 hypothetical protein [Pelomonas sp. V22]
MNFIAKTIVLATVCAATLSAFALAYQAAAPQPKIVKLERVVVVGKRMGVEHIAQLPRVVIDGRRNQVGSDLQVAQAPACLTKQVC